MNYTQHTKDSQSVGFLAVVSHAVAASSLSSA